MIAKIYDIDFSDLEIVLILKIADAKQKAKLPLLRKY